MKPFFKVSIVAALSLIAGVAHADSYSSVYSFITTSTSSTVNVAKFDSLGGTRTLTGILIDYYDVQLNGNASVTLTNPSAQAVSSMLTSGNINLRWNSNNLIRFVLNPIDRPNYAIDTLASTPAISDTTDYGGAYQANAGADPNADGTPDIFTSSISIANAVGAGTGSTTALRSSLWGGLTTANQTFTLANTTLTTFNTNLTNSQDTAVILQTVTNTVTGKMRVTYSYNGPTGVPEPASVALITMGVVGMVVRRKRA